MKAKHRTKTKGMLALASVLCLFPVAVWAQATGRGVLSGDDISGIYSFLREGESVQLNVDHGKLSGWVSSFGFLDSDKDTLLDRFFDKATLQNDHIYFLSRRIHGCWVEFTGRVSHGEGRARGKEGFYVLTGTLTQYTTDAETKVSARQREVIFKSASDPTVAEK
ncbi:MAG TPA: hypothetical protein VK699_06560 [Terriglobales bacterium]|nr:hypothetical protein [Terriglobales bacterium]